MFKVSLSNTKIAFISIVVALMGLLAEFSTGTHDENISLLKSLGHSITIYENSTYIGEHGKNWVVYSLYGLLLLGAILYVISRQKEKRLIRFVFSVIFASWCFSLLHSFYFIIFSFKSFIVQPNWLIWFAINKIICLGWLFLSYTILNNLGRNTPVLIEEKVYGNDTFTEYIPANLWQRLWHRIIDLTLMGLFVYTYIRFISFTPTLSYTLFYIQSIVGERGALLLVLLFFSSIYYTSFETIFGATPGKFLTETRVLTENGDKAPSNIILSRTLCRFIPFEGISFFVPPGWHDRWSKTMVVKEERTGVSGEWYLLLPIVIGMIVGLSMAGLEVYKTHVANETAQINIEEQQKVFDDKLSKLSTNDFFEIKGEYYESEKVVYLKTEKIANDKIQFSLLIGTARNTSPQLMLEKLYAQNKGNLQQMSFSKNQLKKAYQPLGINRETVGKLNIANDKFTIHSIQEFYGTNLQLDNSGGYGSGSFSLALKNVGWPCQVISIEPAENNTKIDTRPPSYPLSYGDYNNNFRIEGNVENGSDFAINIVIRDTTGRQQTYQEKGNTNSTDDRSLVRIK